MNFEPRTPEEQVGPDGNYVPIPQSDLDSMRVGDHIALTASIPLRLEDIHASCGRIADAILWLAIAVLIHAIVSYLRAFISYRSATWKR